MGIGVGLRTIPLFKRKMEDPCRKKKVRPTEMSPSTYHPVHCAVRRSVFLGWWGNRCWGWERIWWASGYWWRCNLHETEGAASLDRDVLLKTQGEERRIQDCVEVGTKIKDTLFTSYISLVFKSHLSIWPQTPEVYVPQVSVAKAFLADLATAEHLFTISATKRKK